VLHHVQARPFLEQPAGEDAPPLRIGLANVHLHEGAGILLGFPGRGALAGAQADDHVADARRLAGLEVDVLRRAVALVEDAEHRLTVLHRRGAGIGIDAHAAHRDHIAFTGDAAGRVNRTRAFRHDHVDAVNVFLIALPIARAAAQAQEHCPCGQDRQAAETHASGAQAS